MNATKYISTSHNSRKPQLSTNFLFYLVKYPPYNSSILSTEINSARTQLSRPIRDRHLNTSIVLVLPVHTPVLCRTAHPPNTWQFHTAPTHGCKKPVCEYKSNAASQNSKRKAPRLLLQPQPCTARPTPWVNNTAYCTQPRRRSLAHRQFRHINIPYFPPPFPPTPP